MVDAVSGLTSGAIFMPVVAEVSLVNLGICTANTLEDDMARVCVVKSEYRVTVHAT